MNIRESRERMIHIAESFSRWLEDIAKEYNMSKDDVQALIKQFLIG